MGLRPLPYGVRVGVLCVIYFAAAKFGLSLDAVSGFAAAVWPPTGIALAMLVLGGYCLWPSIALGALLVNLSAGAPVLVACGMALGNTLEALVGAILLKRVVGFQPSLGRLQDIVGLVVLTGLSTLVGATIGVTSGWLGGAIPAAALEKAWWTWWLGDALGNLVVAPLLFVWSEPDRVALPRRWIAEAVATLVAVGAVTHAVFSGALAQALQLPRYLIFLPLMWAAVRLGPRGAVMATALASAIATWAVAQGFSPFAGQTLHESLCSLQAFMSIVAVTMLILAAAVAERQQAEAAVQEQRGRLAVTLSSIGDAVMATDTQGRVTFMNPVAESITGWPEAEALGKDITEVFRIVNEHTRQVIENPIAKVLRTGTVVGFAKHTLLVARDGVERPIDDSGAPIRDLQGQLLGVVLVCRDITARRQADAEAERRQRETAMLTELAQSLSGTLDLDTVLQRVVAGAQELCGGERVFITLREAGSSALVGRYEIGAPHMAYTDLRIESGKGLGGQVLCTRRPWRTANYATDPRFGKEYLANARAQGHLAVLAVPILLDSRVEGVFYVSNPPTHPFTDRDEEILVRLAAHAAIAIQNAQLYREAQEDLSRRRQTEKQLTASLREKDILLKELHHRVKNNLQIISSLLDLQVEATDDPRLLALFQDSQDRIRSMALIHEALYQSPDLARLDLGRYILTLSAQLMQSYGVDPQRITFKTQMAPVLLDIDRMIPCGLILTELLSNVFKYAFPHHRLGEVYLELHADTAQQATLVVRDTGVGFPDGVDFRHTPTLGLQLVCMLTEQLKGTIRLERQGGTTFTLAFPIATA